MRRNFFSALLLVTLALASSTALSSTDDTQQPIHIEADQAEINEREGIMTYTGHVLLKQGGIELRAETVVVYTKDGELQRITAQGKPVHYLQKKLQQPSLLESPPTSTTKEIKGVSQRMEYRAKDKRLLLLGNAEFWQGGNRFSGNRIQYDPETERVIASAGDSSGEVNHSKPPRVSVTLQPKTSTPKSDAKK